MGRSPCCEKEAGLKKGPWTPEEDQKLLAFIEQHGHGCWRSLPAKAGECCYSCPAKRERKMIDIVPCNPPFRRWSAIATHLPKRTDNEIKNYWNTHLKKRLAKMGIDPVTHKPRADAPAAPTAARYRAAAHLSHTAQWESARLEAEARLAREAKLRALASTTPQPAPQTHAAASGLESPTSTLSFSAESALFAGAAQPVHIHTQQQQQHSYVDAFGEHQHRFDEPAAQQDGFLARVLLDCSVAGAEQGFAATSTDHPGAGEQGEDEEEEDKGYWNSILNMVNSSMSSSSSSLTSETVTDQAVYLPAAAAAEF
ncbi:hypothetical protein PR202_gb08898 [Eleusine coracana subsp. coracana]|uniref:Uncharacterized protein n=1 Tax=Eleusine coracana subsp. coracana TaxID=191504 RepID=A0AAV5EG28_ELECO|nr:hypothetical protein PR202_gb08898 [Eleusine coracana subsp. coracana]